MTVALLHPEWDRSCKACETYRVDSSGTFQRDKRTGLPLLRPKGVPTPCGSCAKVPAWARRAGLPVKDLRAMAADMTDRSRAAWQFYRECRAVNQFPDDPLVRWYGGIIRDVTDDVDRRPMAELSAVLSRLLKHR